MDAAESVGMLDRSLVKQRMPKERKGESEIEESGGCGGDIPSARTGRRENWTERVEQRSVAAGWIGAAEQRLGNARDRAKLQLQVLGTGAGYRCCVQALGTGARCFVQAAHEALRVLSKLEVAPPGSAAPAEQGQADSRPYQTACSVGGPESILRSAPPTTSIAASIHSSSSERNGLDSAIRVAQMPCCF